MTLLRALVALVPAGMLLLGSATLLFRRSSLPALLQLLGSGAIVAVVLAHLCEALHLPVHALGK
jgi:hypothetical protein